jgi:hypothetical protein
MVGVDLERNVATARHVPAPGPGPLTTQSHLDRHQRPQIQLIPLWESFLRRRLRRRLRRQPGHQKILNIPGRSLLRTRFKFAMTGAGNNRGKVWKKEEGVLCAGS